MGRISVHGVPGASSGSAPITGSGSANQVAIFSSASTISGSAALTTALASAAGTANTLTVTHADNTNTTSHALLQAVVGGASGGSPGVILGVTGVSGQWYIINDNTNGDALTMGIGTNLYTNQRITLTNNGTIASVNAFFHLGTVIWGQGAASATGFVQRMGITDGTHTISGSTAANTGGNIVLGGTGAPTVTLRSAATAGLTVLSGGKAVANVGLGVGNSAAATVAVGTLANKFEVFDAAGASIGFVPVYASIT